MRRGSAPWMSDVVPRQLQQLGFASFPMETHPIDLVSGRQGWGPFAGPWQPVDFIDPAQNISLAWAGDNDWRFAPPYATVTLFHDPSLDRVANSGLFGAIREALGLQDVGMSSTAANSSIAVTASQRLRSLVGLN